MSHDHNLVDLDPTFIIDPITRAITTENKKLKFMRGDHNFERCTFEIPQYIDGHDMSLCNDILVHYENTSSANRNDISKGPYRVTDVNVSDDKVRFSWLVSGNAAKYAGTLQFSISFKCIVDSEVIYAWHTDTYKGIVISDTINNSGEELIETYTDIITEWENRLFGSGSAFDGFTDTVTGLKYKLEVVDGELTMVEVTT